MRRYELSDQQWARIAPLFPQHPKAGRPPKDHRSFVDGILWILHTGDPWRDLPEHYGPWQTVFYRFNGWRRDGTGSTSSPRLWMNSTTRANSTTTCGASTPPSSGPVGQRPAGGKKGGRGRRRGGRKETQMQEPLNHALGRSRGGFGTKIHLACEKHGFIVALHITPGQAHKSKAFEPTMARRLFHRRRGQRRWPSQLAGDKGYSYTLRGHE